MKRTLKTILSIFLTAVIVLSCTSVAFAKNDVTPVICIHGMGAIPLYKNAGTDEEADASAFEISSLFTVYNGLLKKVLAAANGEKIDANGLIDEIADLMKNMDGIACDKNGNSIENVSIRDYWTDGLANHLDYLDSKSSSEPAIAKQICDKIGAENVYAFNYDWRLDACENAKKLSTFIDNVKAQTGKKKVTLVSGSEGTVVAAAYIDMYMNKNDIEKTVFVNGAFDGVSICKMYAMDLHIDKDTLLSFLWELSHNYYNNLDFNLKSLSFLSYTLSDTVENLCNLLNEIADSPELMKRLYNEVLYPVYGCIPIMWEFIPYDSFDTAVSKMSSIGFLDKSGDLYKKITKYHAIQGRLESNLHKLRSKGVEVAIISNYGMPAIPVTSDYALHSDALIDTVYSSVGATVADFNKTLNASGKYVSADKVIDASTCALPDNTWFIKNLGHMDFEYGSETTEFLATLVTTKTSLNIGSIKKATGVGQFFGIDTQQNIIDVTQAGSTAGPLNLNDIDINPTTTTDGEKKSPMTGSNDILISLSVAFVLTLLAMSAVLIHRRKVRS